MKTNINLIHSSGRLKINILFHTNFLVIGIFSNILIFVLYIRIQDKLFYVCKFMSIVFSD